MTLDEAIQHCREQVQEQAKKGCYSCAEEHKQLAEWLKELKELRVHCSQLRRDCNEAIDVIGKLRDELKAYREQGGDAISRREALNAITMAEVRWQAVDNVNKLPSVTPQQRKTQMLDESNFDVSQYEMDLRSAYDCGRASTQQRTGRWLVQPSNKEQGERDFIWWKCSECGQVIFSETEKDRREYHAYCGRCGAKMEVEE